MLRSRPILQDLGQIVFGFLTGDRINPGSRSNRPVTVKVRAIPNTGPRNARCKCNVLAGIGCRRKIFWNRVGLLKRLGDRLLCIPKGIIDEFYHHQSGYETKKNTPNQISENGCSTEIDIFKYLMLYVMDDTGKKYRQANQCNSGKHETVLLKKMRFLLIFNTIISRKYAKVKNITDL